MLVPTRELAVQVRDEIEKLAHGRRIACVPVYGGKPIRGQIAKLQQGAEVVVGTPGRVLDLHGPRLARSGGRCGSSCSTRPTGCSTSASGPTSKKSSAAARKSRQTLLLSATVAPPRRAAGPEVHARSGGDGLLAEGQGRRDDRAVLFHGRPRAEVRSVGASCSSARSRAQAIVFCRTKRGTDRVWRKLSKKLQGVDVIHGDLVQTARDRVMKAFRAGEVRILVATDVVGRGIDVTSISHIINYDIPQSSDDYVHRVGRTGRMGREGVAFTFVTTEEGGELTRIEMLINRLLEARRDRGLHWPWRRRCRTRPRHPLPASRPRHPPLPPNPPTANRRHPHRREKRPPASARENATDEGCNPPIKPRPLVADCA